MCKIMSQNKINFKNKTVALYEGDGKCSEWFSLTLKKTFSQQVTYNNCNWRKNKEKKFTFLKNLAEACLFIKIQLAKFSHHIQITEYRYKKADFYAKHKSMCNLSPKFS